MWIQLITLLFVGEEPDPAWELPFSDFPFLHSSYLISCTPLSVIISHLWVEKTCPNILWFHIATEIFYINRKWSHRKTSNLSLILQRVGSLSSALSVCHPVQIGNPITYKGIRKVLPAESIYPIPIVVWKSEILRVVLFQELLFETMQCLFRVQIRTWKSQQALKIITEHPKKNS